MNEKACQSFTNDDEGRILYDVSNWSPTGTSVFDASNDDSEVDSLESRGMSEKNTTPEVFWSVGHWFSLFVLGIPIIHFAFLRISH